MLETDAQIDACGFDRARAWDTIDITFERQRRAFKDAPYPSLNARRATLRRLRDAIRTHAMVCADAAREDFGIRASDETLLVDLLPSLLHIDHLRRHLRRWMRPSRRSTELLFKTNRAAVHYQPKGVVGIVVPWNFPYYLALGPLATALAAGNRCMIKTSEYAPHASRALRALLEDVCDADEVAVVEGDADCARRFCALPFNHLVFTGSPAVGRHVMQAASRNLTPVTLELGGKSPAVVLRSASIETAARRIVHGKLTNAGQVCVAPDYAFVPQESVDAFCEHARRAHDAQAGDGASATSMIDARGYARMEALLDDARDKGAHVIVCGPNSPETRQFALHIVTNVSPRMRIAREEIFGPILPVFAYASFDDTIDFIRCHERPLALYCFGHDREERERLLRETHAGGVTFNDWGWHVLNHDLPFGGSGTSGMGNYHGEEGFRELSHAKAVFSEHRAFPIELFHPPYGRWAQRLAMRWYFGADVAAALYAIPKFDVDRSDIR
ncbi:coniferyl aldehyde dehydrogenase [Pararobbsia silviterrae]|uniref:Aldehyde dehydrogenase n=1 Tax=Pararobbsia silviterrae TaxID=1792498 RepID=A0A494Y8F8_9BURK|nr:coniferyl aldehyde dehydrogenase [Pararobbsia silviterrae]RKP56596.1 coniferyl aldehyde dehydrogenase [Pararobbsia silviterrae]